MRFSVTEAEVVNGAAVRLRLAAVVYEQGAGEQVSGILERLSSDAARRGFRTAGVVQHDRARADRRRCDMSLRELASGREFRISEDRGAHARGCHLDTGALEEAAALVEESVCAGADLLIINKFGKREAEGGGFISALAAAVERDIPAVIGVAQRNLPAWHAFARPLAEDLPADDEEVARWFASMVRSDPPGRSR